MREEPEEGDIIWDQATGGVSYNGKYYGKAIEVEDVFELLEGEFGNHSPGAWMISDHGNAHPWEDFWQEYEEWKEENAGADED